MCTSRAKTAALLACLACLPLPRALAAAPAEELRYSILMLGNPAGSQVTRVVRDPHAGSEVRDIAFEFNDRGRGPKIEQHLKIGARGLVKALSIRGNDYLKTAVWETLVTDSQGGARWENPAERGEKVASGSFYLSLNGAPEETAVLARALLQSLDYRLPLLPEGEARIERVGEQDVVRGSAPSQETMRVTQFAIHGLGFTPVAVWLDRGGEYFASAAGWLNVIRAGWEESLPALKAREEEETAKRSTALAQRLLARPVALAIRHARLFDPESGRVVPDTTIVVRGTRITAVGRDAETAVPDDATIVDADGKTVLPGLWDMHAHVSELDGLLNLAAGVTSVRDMANDIDTVAALRHRWDAGEAIGPRVLLAGFIDGPGPYAGPSKVLVDTEADAIAWVNRYADLGYVQIKLYSSLKAELVPAILAEAHRRGLRVSGHIPTGMTAEECVRLGFDELQHANFLFLNFWKVEVPDTRTPARFHAIGERAAALDLASPPVRSFLELLAQRHIVVDPTLATFESMFLASPGQAPPGYARIADRLPAQVRRSTLTGGLAAPAGMEQRYRDGYQAMVKMVGELYRAGVTLVAGTDDLAGFALHRELELYADAGLPPAEILKIATLGAARVMKRDQDLGSVAPGKLADFVLVEGDPLARIADVRNVRLVVKDGWPLAAADLYREIGVRP
jgi:imidazolonepropionase-like amidohydrolase